jgi:hypothetical protein
MAVAINQATHVWIGDQCGDVTTDFLGFFRAQVQLDACCFAQLDTTENLAETKMMYERFKAFPDFLTNADTPTMDILSDSSATHLQRLRVLKDNKVKVGMVKVGSHAGVVADASQNPQFRHRAGPWLPTITISSEMVALTTTPENHLFTANELSFSQGWPTLGFVKEKYKRALNFDISRLGRGLQRTLLGNGMHLTAFSMWFLYVAAHTIRRADFITMCPALVHSVVVSDPDEDEVV